MRIKGSLRPFGDPQEIRNEVQEEILRCVQEEILRGAQEEILRGAQEEILHCVTIGRLSRFSG